MTLAVLTLVLVASSQNSTDETLYRATWDGHYSGLAPTGQLDGVSWHYIELYRPLKQQESIDLLMTAQPAAEVVHTGQGRPSWPIGQLSYRSSGVAGILNDCASAR